MSMNQIEDPPKSWWPVQPKVKEYIIRLERGVWYKELSSNGRTLERNNATRFPSSEKAVEAQRKLDQKRYPDALVGYVGSKRAWFDLED